MVLWLSACAGQPAASRSDERPTAFVGATVWPGGEAEPIENAVLVVAQGRVVSLSQGDAPQDAAIVDLDGAFVVPGLINAHGHIGVSDGLDKGPSVADLDLVRRDLDVSAHYGITSVVSLGEEPAGSYEFAVRQGTTPGRARLELAGDIIETGPIEAVREQTRRQAAAGADWTKIRIDDDLGRGEKMPPAVYTAIIEASHEAGLPVAVHIVELSDAKATLAAGADLLAHSVRDVAVDDALIGQMLAGDHCITPTLTREVSTYVYAERPSFFDDPFLLETVDPATLAELQRPEVQARYTGRGADYYREQLPVALANLMRLHEAGVRIAMGTDSGQPARFIGYFEHVEMQMMQEAGMTPRAVLRSATDVAAACMGLAEVGTLEPGQLADFVVLAADPLEDVAHLRQIEAVYIGGEAVRD